MAAVAPAPRGILPALRALGDVLLASVQGRLELFTIELQEEKFRLIRISVWGSAALFAGMMAVTFASLSLVCLFWENARLIVLGGLTVLYTGVVTALVIALRRYLARQPKPFAATLHELAEDRACIRNKS